MAVEDRNGRLRKRARRRSPGSPGVPSSPGSPLPTPIAAVEPAPEPAPAPPTPVASPGPPVPFRERRVDHTERALRGLVTTRGTQVSWSAATRAREAALPTAEDLADAEAELIIVRRNYTPPEPLKTARTDPAGRSRRGGR